MFDLFWILFSFRHRKGLLREQRLFVVKVLFNIYYERFYSWGGGLNLLTPKGLKMLSIILS